MPSPEQLGVARPAPAECADTDWAAVHRRLERLGAVCFRLDQLPQGSHRASCLLPTDRPGHTHHIEAEAATAAEAVQLAVARAEAWAAGK
jgi:hypothetical protein